MHEKKAKWAFKPMRRSPYIKSYPDIQEFNSYIKQRDQNGKNISTNNSNPRRLPVENVDVSIIDGEPSTVQKNVDSGKIVGEEMISILENNTIEVNVVENTEKKAPVVMVEEDPMIDEEEEVKVIVNKDKPLPNIESQPKTALINQDVVNMRNAEMEKKKAELIQKEASKNQNK